MKKRTQWSITAASIATIIFAWFLIAQLKLVPEVLVPSPQKVALTFANLLRKGYKETPLLIHLLTSMRRLLLAFSLSVVTAVPLGLLSGYNAKIRAAIDPLIEFYRPLPPLAYYTLLVLWMGIEDSSKIALLFLASFAPIYVACVAAVTKIRQDYVNCAFTLGASKRQMFINVIFPICLPEMFVGLRTAIGVAYTTVVAAEMVAAISGIGWMVLDASRYLRSDIIFVGIIIMGITGILIDRLLRFAENRIIPWKGKM